MISIDNKARCTGCWACLNVCPKHCITMLPDEEGFVYPVVDEEKCINCGLCDKHCPVLHENSINNPVKIYGLKNKNHEMLMRSASGGVFIELAKHVIQNNGFVVGAKWTDRLTVEHSIADSYDDCIAFMGSKYLPSEIGGVYQKIRMLLNSGDCVLFSGTPCQVAGLKHFLNKPYDGLITVDLICHGVPSPAVFKSYIQHIEKSYKKNVVQINMRDKTKGWAMFIKMMFSDGSCICDTRETRLFNSMYAVHYATRPSCHNCPYANCHREGDITIGDYWTIKKYHPDFYDSRGVSSVIVNTDKGGKVLENIIKDFDVVDTTIEEIMQNNLYQSAPPSSARKDFFSVFFHEGYESVIRKYQDYGVVNRIKYFARRVLTKVHVPIPKFIKSTIQK